jgi:16S rRNA (uracil1498-N3)-methyltransferase
VTNFYVLPQDVVGDKVRFRGDEARHLCAVHRKTVGDMINAVDGQGNELTVILENVRPEECVGRLIRLRRKCREPVSRVTLAQAVTKGGKLDMVIQKGTELGVHRFVPMITENTTVSPDETSSAKKQRRWQKIAISAMKQSLRSYLPQVDSVVSFDRVLQEAEKVDLALMASVVKEARSLDRILEENRAPRDILLLVGPEGGFSSVEISQAMQTGIYLITLGPRRLRAETAGILLAGLALFRLGELG